MRLATKVMVFIFIEIFLLLSIEGYLSIQREIKLFDRDMRRDTKLLGSAMKELVSDVWQKSGKSRALELIQRANIDGHPVQMRWVRLNDLVGEHDTPHIPGKYFSRSLSSSDQPISIKALDEHGFFNLYTYIPVQSGNKKMGAIEISEPLSESTAYIHESIIRSVIMVGVMMLLSGSILLFFGIKMVGRPLNQLLEKTRRVGKGDFSGDLDIPGRDELSKLAKAMNRMCEQLATAKDAVRLETEARISALEQLRHTERLATLGRLSSGIAHELGTPLNVILGRANVLATENLAKKEIVEYSGIIKSQTQRMIELIRQLLDFARRRAPQKSIVDLRNLLDQVLKIISPIAAKQHVVPEIIGNLNLPAIMADPFQMEQVLINLVMNGIQAMPNGGRLEVGFHVKHIRPLSAVDGLEKDYLVLHIQDEGDGISKDVINHIFDPFFTTKAFGKGTGLGLSIAYGIVQEHDGWIDVESIPCQGARFTIYLPLEENSCKEKS